MNGVLSMESVEEHVLGVRYTYSKTSINGIAFGKKEDIVINFALSIRRGGIDAEGKPWSTIILRTESNRLGVKILDIFDNILSKYGERDWRYPRVSSIGLECIWHVYDEKLEKTLNEIKQTLEKYARENP